MNDDTIQWISVMYGDNGSLMVSLCEINNVLLELLDNLQYI
jgi:hypothetical protein